MTLGLPEISAIVALAVVASAAIQDRRTRRVPDVHWTLMAALTIPLASAMAWDGGGAAGALLLLAGDVLLAAYMLSPALTGVRGAAVLFASAALCMASAWASAMPATAAPPLLCMLLVSIRGIGGALPEWPAVGTFLPPPQLPVLSIAFCALAMCIPYGIRNIISNIGTGCPAGLIASTSVVPVSEARGAFA